MSDLYRWTNQSAGAWIDTETMRQELVDDGVLEVDTTVSGLAAAWKDYLTDSIDGDIEGISWTKLAALLDALEADDES